MSFDLFVGSFIGGERASFPATVLRGAFGPFIIETEPKWFVLSFGPDVSDKCALYVDTNADQIDSFSIDPLDDSRLYEALFSILKIPGLTLYMPGSCPPLVGHAETAEHLPAEMIQTLGEALLLKAASEIPERIRQS
ncbi:hypothetical protein AACH06_29735 [Ideonella sp. DXS29W]|uniref:DUF1851 domain-containing protein n=1 Tax=Ideonella lacteola TaxID=2984193 RepID=A0ABU9BYF4_9BURK